MWMKVAIAIVVVLAVFLGYVATRSGTFNYEANRVIAASPEKIFPYLVELKRNGEWSPFEKADPNMKKVYSDTDGVVGATMEFSGNSDAGAGRMEILNIVPNELVEIKLVMTAPMYAENLVQYRLTPEGDSTRMTWSMSGDGGYFNKLMTVFIDVEKMIKDQFSKGLEDLKTIVESTNP